MPPIPPHKGGQEPHRLATHPQGAWARCRCCPLGLACCRRVEPSPGSSGSSGCCCRPGARAGQGRGVSTLENSGLPQCLPPWTSSQRSPRSPSICTPWPLHFFAQPSISKNEVFLHCPSKQICNEKKAVSATEGTLAGDQETEVLHSGHMGHKKAACFRLL